MVSIFIDNAQYTHYNEEWLETVEDLLYLNDVLFFINMTDIIENMVELTDTEGHIHRLQLFWFYSEV